MCMGGGWDKCLCHFKKSALEMSSFLEFRLFLLMKLCVLTLKFLLILISFGCTGSELQHMGSLVIAVSGIFF